MPAGEVPAQFALGLLPASQRLRGRRDPRRDTEHVQQSVVRQRVQITAIDFHCFLEGPRPQPDLRHRKGLKPPGRSLTIRGE